MSQRYQIFVQLSTSFYCTRVKKPSMHGWKKSKYMIRYTWRTRCIILITSVDDKLHVIIWADGSHAANSNVKGYSLLCVMMTSSVMINASTNISLVITSSIETEKNSTGERFPEHIWFLCWIEETQIVSLLLHQPFLILHTSMHISFETLSCQRVCDEMK